MLDEIKKAINKIVKKNSLNDGLSDDLSQFKILIYYKDHEKIVAMLYCSYSSDEKYKKRYYYYI